MAFEHLNRFQTIDHLISIKGTGTPKDLARRIRISERSIYGYLQVMKSLGAPIRYCKSRRSYYYQTDGRFEISFKEIINS
ncbi:MAG: HTH domain-containing protein [Chitinophagaceae bacterium]